MPDNNQIIAASLTVNSEEAVKNVLKLKGTVEDLRKEFKKTQAGSDEQLEALKKLKTAEEDLTKAQKKLSESNKETSGHFSKIKESIGAIPGATGAAAQGVDGLNTKFKALLANPVALVITAIVAALALLYKAFTNTFAGAQKVEEIFAGIKAAAQALFDNLSRLANAIVKFFSFDFSGAIDEIKGVANAVGDAYTQMAKLTREAQKLHQEQLANDLDAAERQKKLAILREQADDESIPIAKRKAALKELKDAAEENAKSDIDLARRTAENKIAQLTLEKDGAKKNQDEINKIKIEQIKVETDNANELRRIGKQLTAAEKQELADRKAAQQKANEEQKRLRQEYIEFTNKLTKLQQENELSLIKDGYEKELKALENRMAGEKRINQQAFADKKITRDQLNQLDEELNRQANIQRDEIRHKRNKEITAKEIAFEKELAGITNKTRVDAIKDSRQSELLQLEIGYQEKLAQAIEKYKDDSAKLAQIKTAIDEQYRIEKQKLDEKNAAEDAKKKLDADLAAQEAILNDPKSNIEQRQAAIDAEQEQIQAAYDNKILTIEQYNAKKKELASKEMAIDELIAQNKVRSMDLAANALTAFADLVGKNTTVGKIAAIAATTINTYEAAWSIFKNAAKNPASIPFPAYPYIQAGLAIVAGLKTVNDIVKVKVPGGAGGSAPSPSSLTAPSAPLAPVASTTKLDADSINNIGNAAAGGVNGVRAYVVEGDVSDSQERAARLNRAARLGG